MTRSSKKYLSREENHGSKFADYNEGLYKLTRNETINRILLYIDTEVKLAQERTFGSDPAAYIYALQELRKILYPLGDLRDCSGERVAGTILRWQNTQYPGSGSRKVYTVCDDYFSSIAGFFTELLAPPHLKAQRSVSEVMASVVESVRCRKLYVESNSTGNETIDDILTIIDEEIELASERTSDFSRDYIDVLQQLREMLCGLARPSNQKIVDAIHTWRTEGVEERKKTNETICDAYFRSTHRAPTIGFFTPTYLKGHHFVAVMGKVIADLTEPTASLLIG